MEIKHVRRSVKTGLPPGTLIPVGKAYSSTSVFKLIVYGDTGVTAIDDASLDDVRSAMDSGQKVWLQVHGLHEVEKIQPLGDIFGLHPLVLEDIVNTDQRPKLEEYNGHLFVILKKVSVSGGSVSAEQVSLILGKRHLITFFELDSGFMSPIEARLENKAGKIFLGGVDYLAYTVVDLIVDNYYLVLESYSIDIEELEARLISSPSLQHLEKLQVLKRTIIKTRKNVWPLREIIGRLEKVDGDLIADSTTPYLRDVYDHTIQIAENLESYRDLLSGLLDIYLSSISNKLNEVMKVLTIISTIFIPLSFIAGLCGMNFVRMPELSWKYGYPVVLMVMAVVAGGMVLFFRRKKWL